MTDAHLITIHTTTDIGTLAISGSERGIQAVGFVDEEHSVPSTGDVPDVLRAAVEQLDAYFAGQRTTFDLLLDWHGTAFEQRVWTALLEIPFGETRTYGQVA
ncbi:MAG: hypothetical protein GYB65_18115, partial [Chloroflexi bacterium]|nr:hypothetical protein [Chloroflexota bacterium]